MAVKSTQLALLFAGLFLSTNVSANACGSLAGQSQYFVEQNTGQTCGTTNQYSMGQNQCCDMVIEGSGGDDETLVCIFKFTGTSCGSEPEPDPTPPNPNPNPDPFTPSPHVQVSSSQDSQMASGISTNFSNLRIDINALKNGIYNSGTVDTATYNYVYGIKNEQQNQRNMLSSLMSLTGNIGNVATNTLAQSKSTATKLDTLTSQSALDTDSILDAIEAIQDETILDNLNYTNGQLASFDNRFRAVETNVSDVSTTIGSIDFKIEQVRSDIAALDRGDTGGGDTGGGGTGTQWHIDVVDTLSSIDEASWNSTSQLETSNTALSSIQSDAAITREYTQFLSSDFNDYWSDTSDQLDGIKTAIESSGGGAGDDDTETNQKLQQVIENTSLINDNLVTNGMNNEHATQQAGQHVTDAVNGLGEKLDDIGESIDGLSDPFAPGTGQKSGPSKCTGEGCWKQASWIDSDYPDGVAGIWEERKVAFGGSAMKGYLDSFAPNLQGGTVAPLQLCFDTGLANFGCHDFSIPAYVIAFIRLCILISAGFYCQRLVFGGA